ncbi:MAG TPA: ABC transporter permease subunit [Planctomycetota bacterium]|nr:ABC transporter permease subunit [Planctomycetota bacterium]
MSKRWLQIVPFILVILGYAAWSHARHVEDPRDKLVPNLAQLVAGARRVTQAGPDGRVWIADDVVASLRRFALGMGLAAGGAVATGLLMGTSRTAEALLSTFVAGLAKVPPLAMLPLIFIMAGVGEAPKVELIVLGMAPVLAQDVHLRCREVPLEAIQKALTLGASRLGVAFRVVLPVAWPRILDSVRLAIGPAWIYLIAAEAIAADSGLGYRIYVVQRFLGVNIILVYIAVIVALGLAMDAALRLWIHARYPWSLQSS